MHDSYIELILSAIQEKFGSETEFYKNQLGISEETWENWKKGTSVLEPEVNQKIKNLFTDYEWMLLQKVLRQTIIYPEKRTIAVSEFRKMKIKISQKWLNIGLGTVEVLQGKEDNKRQPYVDLKVSISYDEWGFDDVINFRLPATIQQQVENEEIALLNWVNEKLEDTYIS